MQEQLRRRHQVLARPDHHLAQQQHPQEASGQEQPQVHQQLPCEYRDEDQVALETVVDATCVDLGEQALLLSVSHST